MIKLLSIAGLLAAAVIGYASQPTRKTQPILIDVPCAQLINGARTPCQYIRLILLSDGSVKWEAAP